jgi:hypothetical protein
MIDDVDRTLKRLIHDKISRPRTPFVVKFDQPTEDWDPEAGVLNLNFYLYDVRENLELRDNRSRFELQTDGTALRRHPPARINLFYCVTAWSALKQSQEGQILEEHHLLADVLATLLRYQTLPRDVLEGTLVGQQPPLPTLVAQMGEGLPHPPAEFWSSLNSRMRPALNLIVTLALEPASSDPPRRLFPVASEDLAAGPKGGTLLRFGVQPPLLELFEPREEVRAVRLGGMSAGRLAVAVRASDRTIDVADARSVRANEWIRITDGATGDDYVRVPVQTKAGPATLPVEPPLRFAHAANVPVDRLSIDDAPKTFLGDAVQVDETSIPVADRAGLAANDVLMVDDGDSTEFVELTAANPADAGPGVLAIALPLRFAHDAGRPLRLTTVTGNATVLAADANQLTRQVTFAAPGPALPVDTVVMIGQGEGVEFARLAAPASPWGVQQPLRNNHPVDAPVRAVIDEEAVALLARRAAAGDQEVLVSGDGATALGPRDVIRIGTNAGEPSYHEITAAAREAGGLADADRFVHIAGRAVDATDLETPVPRAVVTLVRPAGGGQPSVDLARITADEQGRFQFRDITPGDYLLHCEADRFTTTEKPVAVPSTRFDEYDLRLNSN